MILVVGMLFLFTGCGDNMVIEGKKYTTYGLMNENDRKADNVEYEIVWGNVVWGIILFQTIIAPVYFFGFSMFEPVGVKGE